MAVNAYHEIEIKNGSYTIKFTPADYTVDYQSLVGPDSGRTMDGSMIISDWYLRKTTKLTVKLPPHYREDPLYSRVFSYVQGQVVKVSYYDYLSHTYKTEIEMYCSETSMGWSYKGLVNDASFELIEMKGDKTVTPVTSTTQYTITATVSPSGSGTVTGAGTFYQGATCVLVATPATGYHFDHWGSNTADTNPIKSFTVSSNASYTANFVADAVTYTISTSVAPTGSGSVSGGGNYLSGTSVTLRATPASGYIFSHWGSDSTDTSASKTFTVSGNASYTANFTTAPTEYWEIQWNNDMDMGYENSDDEDPPYDYDWYVEGALNFNFTCNGVTYAQLHCTTPWYESDLYYGAGNNGKVYDYTNGWVNNNYKTIITYTDPATVFVDGAVDGEAWATFLSGNATVTHHS